VLRADRLYGCTESGNTASRLLVAECQGQ